MGFYTNKYRERNKRDMEIMLHTITIRELFEGYKYSYDDDGKAYGGRLNIPAEYKRDFKIKHEQQVAVIKAIIDNNPLNTMYWVKNDDGIYEVFVGQLQIFSICEYLVNNISIDYNIFYNLSKNQQEKILNYQLSVYLCEGTDTEKMRWFETLEHPDATFTPQQRRNMVFNAPWIYEARKWFCKRNCPAYNIGSKYVKGTTVRYEFLETALYWISQGNIEQYMRQHKSDADAKELWAYYYRVIEWVKDTFTVYRPQMKGVNWGELYNEYGGVKLDAQKIEQNIQTLMQDVSVKNKRGVYAYVLSGDERHLITKNKQKGTIK